MKIPFTPVIYEHAARFVDRTVWEVSRDPDLMFEAHRRAYLEYRQQVIAVGIDIYNLEAEAYGAQVEAGSADSIPAIHRPLLTALEDGLQLPPFDPQRDGRIPISSRPRRHRSSHRSSSTSSNFRRCSGCWKSPPTAWDTRSRASWGAILIRSLETPPENIRLIREYAAT